MNIPGAEDSLATAKTVGEERETVASMRAGRGRGAGADVLFGAWVARRSHDKLLKLLDTGGQNCTPNNKHAARADDPPFRARSWRRANPSLDHMPDLLDVIRDEAKAAKADPALLPSFKALRLNMGVADIEAAMLLDASTWQRIEAPDRPQADGAYTLALRSRRRGGYECCGRLLAVHGSPRGGGGVPCGA